MKEQLKLAEVKDCGRIQSFLTKAGISSEGVAESIHHFVIMEDENDELLATVGFEKDGEHGLLRSLVVSPSLMRSDILLLFKSIVQLAKKNDVHQLYLVTNKASSVQFFSMMNFQQIHYEELPGGLKHHSYLRNLPSLEQVYVMAYQD
ncbi:GNAT family N-acetyltransferase [Priestia flexa]|uniref:GNAT family N-acetyltransferase n=1 Tax=Priestia TaxID=2800373 RepID=UPI002205FF37|nr:acetyltransferase [Priestia flexa]MDT2044861.1 acetyltransferase [Priestia flexa]USY55056.1 acetyltransferase [Bacillus sp. 1780r2a1]